jgi:hypothetical protein
VNKGIAVKPRVFVGSSVEQLDTAYTIQQNLEQVCDPIVWDQGVFQLSSNTLDDLLAELDQSDFGIFVFAPEDIAVIRNKEYQSTRDNVLFEFGLFIGRLGKQRVFFVLPRDQTDFRLPSDLIGIIPATFNAAREDRQAAMGPACHEIRKAIKKLGSRTQASRADLIKLLQNVNCDAFTTPFGLEQSLIAFTIRVKEVKDLFSENFEKVHPDYTRYVIEIFKLLKALSEEAQEIPTNERFSQYIAWNAKGILIDALRYAIVNRTNDLLQALGVPGDRIDSRRLISDAELAFGCRPKNNTEEINEAKKISQGHRLDPQLVESYMQAIVEENRRGGEQGE